MEAADGNANEVAGVAELYEHVYAALSESNKVLDFASHPPTYFRRSNIVIKAMKDPVDLAACSTMGHLYVADWAGQCVWLVKIDNHDCATSDGDTAAVHWATIDGGPRSLSVTRSGQVLVLDDTVGILLIYTSQGERLDVISLKDKGLSGSNHALQTLTNNFLVCHGRWDATINRVCEIDENGRLLHEFGGRRGHGMGQVSRPFRLVEDDVGSHWFTVDDRKVIVFNKHLCYERVLIRAPPELDCHRNRALCYNRGTRRLCVAWGWRYIDIYTI